MWNVSSDSFKDDVATHVLTIQSKLNNQPRWPEVYLLYIKPLNAETNPWKGLLQYYSDGKWS